MTTEDEIPLCRGHYRVALLGWKEPEQRVVDRKFTQQRACATTKGQGMARDLIEITFLELFPLISHSLYVEKSYVFPGWVLSLEVTSQHQSGWQLSTSTYLISPSQTRHASSS